MPTVLSVAVPALLVGGLLGAMELRLGLVAALLMSLSCVAANLTYLKYRCSRWISALAGALTGAMLYLIFYSVVVRGAGGGDGFDRFFRGGTVLAGFFFSWIGALISTGTIRDNARKSGS